MQRSALQFKIGSDKFIVRKAPQKHIGELSKLPAQGEALLTLFVVEEGVVVDGRYLERQINCYSEHDDVFRNEFLNNIILLRSGDHKTPVENLSPVLRFHNCQNVIQAKYSAAMDGCPRGPYLYHNSVLYQVWKVFDDFNRAFVSAVWPSETDPGRMFEIPPTCGHASTGVGVPVPSRLYDRKSPSRPLAGDRIAVKDNFHLNGVKTSLCSRDYFDLYPEQVCTAEVVQLIIDLGAHVVGKTHLSSFAMWEEPTQCVDFPSPFNPRGDGYQSPAGSSSGSGAAIASYDWLDFTIGTDTTGSGRRPALWNGSFALRPTARLLSTKGMVATSKEFDVPSFFSRGIHDLGRFITSLLDASSTIEKPHSETDLPWRIFYPEEYYPIANRGQDKAVSDFVEVLASHIGCEVERISLRDFWSGKPPSRESDMDEYMSNVQVHGFWFEAYQLLDTFRKEHQQRRGRPPYFTEVNRWIWGIAKLLDQGSYDEAMSRSLVFRKWFLEEVLQSNKCKAIMILPIETLSPRCRDVPPEKKSEPPRSINELWLSPIAGCPELVVPIAQAAYQSRISAQTEYLPVAIGLLGGPNLDVELLRLVQDCLTQAKRPLEVQVGKVMGVQFPRY